MRLFGYGFSLKCQAPYFIRVRLGFPLVLISIVLLYFVNESILSSLRYESSSISIIHASNVQNSKGENVYLGNTTLFSAGNINFISHGARWQNAYEMSSKHGWYPVVMVVFVNNNEMGPNNLLKGRYCKLDNGIKGFARVEALAIQEDRSEHHTIIVHCFFNQKVTGKHIYYGNQSAPIHYQLQQYAKDLLHRSIALDHVTAGNSICIPTLYGSRCKESAFQKYFESYASYYILKLDVRVFRLYTDDLFCYEALMKWRFLENLNAFFEIKFISHENSQSHYHSQRLASFDCYYNSFLDGTKWCFVLDIDEVLQMPWNIFRGMNMSINALTFPSWFYNSTRNQFCNGVVESKTFSCSANFLALSEQAGVRKSKCCFCLKGPAGRRKYSLNLNYYLEGSFSGIHDPLVVQSSDSIPYHIDGRTGVIINHFDFGQQAYDLATKRLMQLLTEKAKPRKETESIKLCH